MTEKPKAASPKTVKKDAEGAFAPSQADSKNNGALAIDPEGEGGSQETSDDHPKRVPEDKARN